MASSNSFNIYKGTSLEFFFLYEGSGDSFKIKI